MIEAKTTTANLTNSYPATIKGKQDVEIRPMVSGFITKLHVDEGATVRKGQVLFSIDPVQYQAAVNSAKAAVETAKAAVNTQELTVNNKRELNKKTSSVTTICKWPKPAGTDKGTTSTSQCPIGQCQEQFVIHQCNEPQ